MCGSALHLAAAASSLLLAGMILPTSAVAAPKSAFVTNYKAATLSQFTFGTGQTLSPNGTVSSGSEPWFEAVTPDGKYLYAADFTGAAVSQYLINADGTLTPLSPATATTGTAPTGVAVSPDGRNLYVANAGGSVSVFDIASGGTLSLTQTETADLSDATGIAVSPDGSSVYVLDGAGGNITEFNRASDGSLTAKSTPTIASNESGYGDIAMTPDGTSLYVSSTGGSVIDEYSVGSGGELSAKSVPSVAGGSDDYALIVSPNGRNVYASDCDGGLIYQFSIGSNAELSPLVPPSVTPGGCPIGSWMTADGAHLYTPNYGHAYVDQYDVSSTGALTPKSPATAAAGSGSLAMIIPPDQGPVAAFSAKAGKAGKATKFNGSTSSDSDGTVAVYHWSFGDGHSLSNGGATPSHTYKKAGKYKVTLTVTDDSGCSLTQVFTGQTAYCNGTPAARIVHRVKIASSSRPVKLSVSPHSAKAGTSTCYVLRATSGGHGVKKATVKLAGHKAVTSASGKAKLCLALKKGTYHARVTKAGYKSAVAAIRVTAATPVFTG